MNTPGDDFTSKVRLEFITVDGKRIFKASLLDYKFENFEGLLEKAGNMIRSERPGSVLCLTQVDNKTPIFTNKEIFAYYLEKNKPYMKASAIYGVHQYLVPILNAIDHFAGRSDIRIFDTEEEAVKWLVSF